MVPSFAKFLCFRDPLSCTSNLIIFMCFWNPMNQIYPKEDVNLVLFLWHPSGHQLLDDDSMTYVKACVGGAIDLVDLLRTYCYVL